MIILGPSFPKKGNVVYSGISQGQPLLPLRPKCKYVIVPSMCISNVFCEWQQLHIAPSEPWDRKDNRSGPEMWSLNVLAILKVKHICTFSCSIFVGGLPSTDDYAPYRIKLLRVWSLFEICKLFTHCQLNRTCSHQSYVYFL